MLEEQVQTQPDPAIPEPADTAPAVEAPADVNGAGTADVADAAEPEQPAAQMLSAEELKKQQHIVTRRLQRAERIEKRLQELRSQIEPTGEVVKQWEETLRADPKGFVERSAKMRGQTPEQFLRDLVTSIRPDLKETAAEGADNRDAGKLQQELEALKAELRELPQRQQQRLEQERNQILVNQWRDRIGAHVDDPERPALAVLDRAQLADHCTKVFSAAVQKGYQPSDDEILDYINQKIMQDYERVHGAVSKRTATTAAAQPVPTALTTGAVMGRSGSELSDMTPDERMRFAKAKVAEMQKAKVPLF